MPYRAYRPAFAMFTVFFTESWQQLLLHHAKLTPFNQEVPVGGHICCERVVESLEKADWMKLDCNLKCLRHEKSCLDLLHDKTRLEGRDITGID
jgi:hypothetical protein